jgi:hypothetical protein
MDAHAMLRPEASQRASASPKGSWLSCCEVTKTFNKHLILERSVLPSTGIENESDPVVRFDGILEGAREAW